MGMANFKVKAVVKDKKQEIVENAANPYRLGSAKRVLMEWAMEQKEGFTKDEFLQAAMELREEGKLESVMPPMTMARAWWNEFYSKYGVFIPVEEQ